MAVFSWGLVAHAAGGDVSSSCTGDCNGDRRVTIDELIRGVASALGGELNCPAFDRDGDHAVGVAELVLGVRFALAGCPEPVCGDGLLEGGEQCDDGNRDGGDCCSPACSPGDGEVICDDGNSCTRDACAPAGQCLRSWTCEWRFEDATAEAGLSYVHAYPDGLMDLDFELAMTSGGVAAGDYDGDGWIDLYAIGGPSGHNRLLRNRGDGTFEDIASSAGVALPGSFGAGPIFVDYDGDGHLDLVVGGVLGTAVRFLHNRGDGSFRDDTAVAGISASATTVGFAFGDFDRDGDLDASMAHWAAPLAYEARLWRNDGGGRFTNASAEAGVDIRRGDVPLDLSFTPNFADIDSDGWPDLLVAGDFGTSQIFRNQRDGTFADTTTATIDDENGMGAAVGDFDNDGDLDWFVSSIWNPPGTPPANWGVTGNRLYRNRGDGVFDDATDEAGVRVGYWGWGSCFADFNLDGHLDLFHVNGWGADLATAFFADPSRLFVSNQDGTFAERSLELGLDETDQGRGVVCFDYDRDGDVDAFVANNGGPPRLWKNRAEGLGNSFLQVSLVGDQSNSQAIGARVSITTGATRQMREIRAGNNFVSQDPALAHFGLGTAKAIDELHVRWPNGQETRLVEQAVDRFIVIRQPQSEAGDVHRGSR